MNANIINADIKLNDGKSFMNIINKTANKTISISIRRLISIKAVNSKPLGLY